MGQIADLSLQRPEIEQTRAGEASSQEDSEKRPLEFLDFDLPIPCSLAQSTRDLPMIELVLFTGAFEETKNNESKLLFHREEKEGNED